jgi:hypothetical protein
VSEQTNKGSGPANRSQRNGPQRNRRRYRGGPNRNRPPSPSSQLDRLVEKYINLLDQHLVARRKFHDLYYRAEIPQLNKLERLFYQSLNDLREFENRIPEEMKPVFNQRVNGLKPDTTYSENHQLNPDQKINEAELEIHDPHLLQSQKAKNYREDTEESVGSLEDYNQYKNL